MAEKNSSESFGDKVWLLFIDKIILGSVVGLVAFLFTFYLHSQELKVDYQKQLFEKRVKAYEEILDKSKNLIDELSLYYYPATSPSSGSLAEDVSWQRRFARIRAQLTGGGSSGWATSADVLEAFEQVENLRRKNSLYFSKRMDREITEFLNTLWKDYADTAARISRKEAIDSENERVFYSKAVSAYEKFRTAVMDSLLIRDIILG